MWANLLHADERLFVWLNGRHAPWLDPIMLTITERNTWIVFYALLVVWLFRQFRMQAWGFLLTIGGAVALADQVASSVFKPFTHRLRPCHAPDLQGVAHILDCGGRFGFISSHASTTFALAMSLWLLLGKRYPAFRWVFVWAAVVSYSRIYVAAHYPLDVLSGILAGLFSAIVAAYTFRLTPSGRQMLSLGF